MGAKCSSFHIIAKADRHGYDDATEFPVSVCEAETIVMQALPEPLRQAFITAKAVRPSSICAPELDLNHIEIVEDLAIDDYITSHALKNCFLSILKKLGPSESSDFHLLESNESQAGLSGCNIRYTFKGEMCKYILADIIYAKYQFDLQNKVMYAWQVNNEKYLSLFDCRDQDYHGDDMVCCRKRKIKLALIKQIRKWLNNRDKLRFLHDGDKCNCARAYSLAEIEYHLEFIEHLANDRSPFDRMNTDTRAFQQRFNNKPMTSLI